MLISHQLAPSGRIYSPCPSLGMSAPPYHGSHRSTPSHPLPMPPQSEHGTPSASLPVPNHATAMCSLPRPDAILSPAPPPPLVSSTDLPLQIPPMGHHLSPHSETPPLVLPLHIHTPGPAAKNRNLDPADPD
ncbi:proline-rich receptor-like protein kinase PERK10 [Penaeus monodon]|uniref:proline-rich receptor-like protein kinase PERK10 n=1 Tax=Penaeus monodon TaxID=6687 RepID=UPI0018A706B7|nr:proline-rich receptor-like protein kinase PERK10 [Penaeus monodon]